VNGTTRTVTNARALLRYVLHHWTRSPKSAPYRAAYIQVGHASEVPYGAKLRALTDGAHSTPAPRPQVAGSARQNFWRCRDRCSP